MEVLKYFRDFMLIGIAILFLKEYHESTKSISTDLKNISNEFILMRQELHNINNTIDTTNVINLDDIIIELRMLNNQIGNIM